jgi:hypothetical protein
LTSTCLGLRPDDLVAVFKDQRAPAVRGLIVIVGGLTEEYGGPVRRVVEKVFRIEDAIDGAPLPPPVGDRPDGAGLPGAGRAVQQQETAAHLGRFESHDLVDRGGRRAPTVWTTWL